MTAETGFYLGSIGNVPELPNIFTFISHVVGEEPWIMFLKHWETVVFSLLVGAFIMALFYFGTKKQELIPSGLQNFLEWIVETLNRFVIEVIGPEGVKFVPFLGTLFLYILGMNWLILIPLLKPPSSNFNVTIGLAICVFLRVQYLNIKNYGFWGFLHHLAGSPKDFMGWLMVPLMLPIELLTQITRPFTLALRLFGNVLGEDILIGVFALFGVFLLSYYNTPIVFPLQLPFVFLAVLTGLMQALVFTLLSAVYILLSIPDRNHE